MFTTIALTGISMGLFFSQRKEEKGPTLLQYCVDIFKKPLPRKDEVNKE